MTFKFFTQDEATLSTLEHKEEVMQEACKLFCRRKLSCECDTASVTAIYIATAVKLLRQEAAGKAIAIICCCSCTAKGARST